MRLAIWNCFRLAERIRSRFLCLILFAIAWGDLIFLCGWLPNCRDKSHCLVLDAVEYRLQCVLQELVITKTVHCDPEGSDKVSCIVREDECFHDEFGAVTWQVLAWTSDWTFSWVILFWGGIGFPSFPVHRIPLCPWRWCSSIFLSLANLLFSCESPICTECLLGRSRWDFWNKEGFWRRILFGWFWIETVWWRRTRTICQSLFEILPWFTRLGLEDRTWWISGRWGTERCASQRVVRT